MSKARNNIRSSKEHSSLSSCSSSSLSSDEEEIDANDLKPIKNYLSNRKELARQLFKSVKPEKIRMMLPQVLKHLDLSELEEYCVNELNGMSKARILAKLNGKPMSGSSDTDESNDSGPSLEIISDTEEWLTDDDTSKKENGKQGKLVKRDKINIKKKTHIKKNDPEKSNSKVKCIKNENISKTNKNVKIKKEDDKDKGKEGDSLLDLLELEMRARAIRALIRKEDDIVPSTNSSEINDSQTIENKIKTQQDDDKAKENCRKQLEQIIGAQQSKGEDEDVVLVIHPTPVVELLSSDSDGEVHDKTRVNQKKNERATETEKSVSNSDDNTKNSSKNLGTQITGAHNNTNIATKTDLCNETRTIMLDRNVDIKNNTLSISISADNVAEKRKKSKKKSHTKLQLTSTSENTSKSKQINTAEIIEQSNDAMDVNTTEELSLSDEDKVVTEEKNKTEEEISKESRIEKVRSADLDEIIDLDDLDDYCDVMDIENDEDKSQDEVIFPSQEEPKQSGSEETLPKSDSTETWASRYYQTDDVQNVIKESKIQSEIRKRLRERQRLSKLNKSPNLNLPSQSSSTDTSTVISEKAPTGSVEEYLALKRAMNANASTTTSNTDTSQDNPSETINSNSDVNVKEILIQDENDSSHQECTDNDAQKVITSHQECIDNNAQKEITESSELKETVADIKHDTVCDIQPE